jgi:pimeloyl-ACP methyl ester carboxylesterase
MAVESEEFTELADEFELVAQTAAEVGTAGADPGVTDEALWGGLSQLGTAAALIRGDSAGPLPAADLARLRERAPGVQVITIPGSGADVVATQPAALAAALSQLLTTAPEGER